MGGLAKKVEECFAVQMMRTGTGEQPSAVLHQFHGPPVDGEIALNCLGKLFPALDEGGRVENHRAEPFLLLGEASQEFECVSPDEGAHALPAVQAGVFLRQCHSAVHDRAAG
ncbi:MAG: hypothetical protein P8Z70_02940 [Desulfuromonadales bacterium]